ncbi:hypothetical protein M432DRAFT_602944 [Thermoascus aurantiacus ATCC 26904]
MQLLVVETSYIGATLLSYSVLSRSVPFCPDTCLSVYFNLFHFVLFFNALLILVPLSSCTCAPLNSATYIIPNRTVYWGKHVLLWHK